MNVAINGFGRIGRNTFKAALDKKAKFKIVAINDLTTPENLAYLLKYDTVYGTYQRKVRASKSAVYVDGVKYPVYGEKDPSQLPWKDLKVDVVVESTGFFTKSEGAKLHLDAGAKAVVISAPGKSDDIKTFLRGVNDKKLGKQKIISNASCTTNCTAPAIAVLENAFGVKKALMTTIHAYTATQRMIDGPSEKDFRRGRAAAENIVPTTTGAAIATTKVIPKLDGKFDGISVRVPVPCGSLTDITAVLKKKVTIDQVIKAYKKAAANPIYKGVLAVSDEPIVSSDIVGNPHSAIVDLPFINVMGGDLVKVLAWYDNEWGYSCRLVEMVERMKV